MSLWNRLRSAPLVVIAVPMLLVMSGMAPANASTDTMPASPTCVITLLSGDESVALPPTCFDPAGSDQDELVVPSILDPSGWGGDISYFINGKVVFNPEVPLSTGGLASLSITTQFWSSINGTSDGPSWRLDFNVDPVGDVSPDIYWVELGKCNYSGVGFPVREASGFVTNVAGADARLIPSVYPDAESVDGGLSVYDTAEIGRVFDGATASTPLVTFDQDTPGLEVNTTYVVKFWRADAGSARDSSNPRRFVASKVKVYVPGCGDSGGSSTKPQAKVRVVRCQPGFSKVRVVLGSKAATKATKYRLVIDPRRGKTFRKTFITAHKVVKLHRLHRVKKGTLVKVTFGKKVVKKRIRGCGS